MQDGASDLSERIARQVRDLRAARRLSLDALATKSGVSRSMISLVERGESSPTASVLEKLATGLGVTLGSLFDEASAKKPDHGPISRREEQPEWRDPASGYVRRNVSPPGEPRAAQIVEIHFPARGRVAFDNGARDLVVHQQVWVLDGVMDVSVGEERHRLRKGDCLAMALDGPTTFHNPARKSARYVVVVTSESRSRGSG
jgi:transcriptional regulator with XRE-family HTH domain